MSISPNDFIHPADRTALKALKELPGFEAIAKKVISMVDEKMYKIENTSSYLRLGPDQLPEIYNILLKVCKRLEIDVPELYLSLDREPNACTYGDTDIFIVLNSGLLETMNLDQIETIISHECGHILCRHVLYHTMGKYLLDFSELFVSGFITKAIVASLQYAYHYWERCSEFSADRVSVYYHNSAEPVVDVMLALAGGTHNLNLKYNKDAFLAQAKDYKMLVDNSTYNKILEFIQFGEKTHPLTAYRAYEANEFYKTIIQKLPSGSDGNLLPLLKMYTLRVKYEYIKAADSLELGELLGLGSITMVLNDTKYEIQRNGAKDIYLPEGEYDIYFNNGKMELTCTLAFASDCTLVVAWDGNKQDLYVYMP